MGFYQNRRFWFIRPFLSPVDQTESFLLTPWTLGSVRFGSVCSVLPLGRRVRVQDPRALHPGADRGHAGGERLLLHGQGPPGEAVLDGEHQTVLLGASPEPGQKMNNNPPWKSRSSSQRTTWIKVEKRGVMRRRRRRRGGGTQESASPKYRVQIQRRAPDSSGFLRASFRSPPRFGALKPPRVKLKEGGAEGAGEPRRTEQNRDRGGSPSRAGKQHVKTRSSFKTEWNEMMKKEQGRTEAGCGSGGTGGGSGQLLPSLPGSLWLRCPGGELLLPGSELRGSCGTAWRGRGAGTCPNKDSSFE